MGPISLVVVTLALRFFPIFFFLLSSFFLFFLVYISSVQIWQQMKDLFGRMTHVSERARWDDTRAKACMVGRHTCQSVRGGMQDNVERNKALYLKETRRRQQQENQARQRRHNLLPSFLAFFFYPFFAPVLARLHVSVRLCGVSVCVHACLGRRRRGGYRGHGSVIMEALPWKT